MVLQSDKYAIFVKNTRRKISAYFSRDHMAKSVCLVLAQKREDLFGNAMEIQKDTARQCRFRRELSKEIAKHYLHQGI
jgi:hypothetical protein